MWAATEFLPIWPFLIGFLGLRGAKWRRQLLRQRPRGFSFAVLARGLSLAGGRALLIWEKFRRGKFFFCSRENSSHAWLGGWWQLFFHLLSLGLICSLLFAPMHQLGWDVLRYASSCFTRKLPIPFRNQTQVVKLITTTNVKSGRLLFLHVFFIGAIELQETW